MKMTLNYYSYYPYNAEDFKVVDHPEHRGSAYDMPFRLYLAAKCTGDYTNEIEFIKDCWEVMDMPTCKGVGTIELPYQLDGITVDPTKHFYGATNSLDGVYELNGKYFIIDYGCDVKMYDTFQEAFAQIALERGCSYYLKGVEFDVQTAPFDYRVENLSFIK